VINLNWVKRHYIQCNLVNMMLIYYFFRISNLTEWWNLTWHWKIGPKSFYFPVSFAKGSLDGNSLEVEKLNQVDLSRIVTRPTDFLRTNPWNWIRLDSDPLLKTEHGGWQNTGATAGTLDLPPKWPHRSGLGRLREE